MEHNLNCEIVRDLLPSYVEGLTSDTTNAAIEEHLTGCTECPAALKRMKEPEPQQTFPDPEVDYLKKVRRRSIGRSLLIAIVLMLAGISMLAFRFLYVGTALEPSELVYSVSVEGNTVNVSGTIAGSSGLGVSRVTFSDSGGMVQMKVYTAPRTFFNSGEFFATYTAQDPVAQVRADDLIIWEDGVEISRVAAMLYTETNPSAGDMPSNSRIATILGVSDQFGPYTNELQTQTEPYGWTLILETPIEPIDEKTARDIMDADSYVMLASIENLGSVTWQYGTETGVREYTVTAEAATAFAGQDIKEFADSASMFQSLLQKLSFKWSGVRETLQEDGTFYLNISNHCANELYSIGVHYYLDDTLIGSRVFENASHEPVSTGAEASFAFIPEDFPNGTSAMDLYHFSFDLFVIDEDGHETAVSESIPVSAKYAWTYFYTLTGDFESGFELNEG